MQTSKHNKLRGREDKEKPTNEPGNWNLVCLCSLSALYITCSAMWPRIRAMQRGTHSHLFGFARLSHQFGNSSGSSTKNNHFFVVVVVPFWSICVVVLPISWLPACLPKLIQIMIHRACVRVSFDSCVQFLFNYISIHAVYLRKLNTWVVQLDWLDWLLLLLFHSALAWSSACSLFCMCAVLWWFAC